MVFLPEAIGASMGGDKKSDGYFWLADSGGRVDGNHFDIFVGEEELYLTFIEKGGTQRFKATVYPLPKVPNMWDPENDKGLTKILQAKGFLEKGKEPTLEELREAVVAFQETKDQIPVEEYGDPDAATTLWFMVQAAIEEMEKEKANNLIKEEQ
jgi:hypothetical protein